MNASGSWLRIRARRASGTVVILDIAVPRDFDPRIHDGDRTCLFNIDDLKRIREQTLHDRMKHLAPAETIVDGWRRQFATRLQTPKSLSSAAAWVPLRTT